MSVSIGDLAIRVGADTSGLIKGLDQSSSKLDEFGKKSLTASANVAKYAAAAAAAGAALATAMVANSISAARETANLAKVANATSGEFTRLAYAAKSVGVQQDKFSDILKDTSDRVGDFLSTGGGPMADFFENIAPKVGVTAEQFRNLSGPQALQLYVSSLEKANISQNEMTFYMEAMASDATALIPLLRNGGAALNEQARMADRLGVALSSIEVEQMNQAAIAMEQAGSVLSGFGDQFAAELSPVLTALSRQFIEAAEEAGGVGEAASDAFGYVVDVSATVINSVDHIKRAFEVTADAIIGSWSAVSANVSEAIEAIAETLDYLPGVDMSESLENIRRFSEDANAVADMAWQNINETLSKPMAGEAFKEYVRQAKVAADAAAAAAPSISGITMPRLDGEGSTIGLSEADREALAGKLETLRKANLEELDILREKHEAELEEIARAEAAKLEIDGTYKDLKEETAKRHADEIYAIEKKLADEQIRQEERKARAKQQIMAGALSSLTTLMNSESRKMFEIGKAAGISQSIISTYTGMSKALELGWPLGPIAAGAIGAAGFAQVASIRSQSFGSGGGASGSPTQAINDSNAAVSSGASSERSVSVNLGFVGGSARDRAVAGSLVEQLNEEIERGGRISRIGLS